MRSAWGRSTIDSKSEGRWWGRGSPTPADLLAVPPSGLGGAIGPRDATASTRCPAVPPSGFTPTAEKSPSWPAVASSRRRRSWAGHFGEIILGHADELMTRDQVGRFL